METRTCEKYHTLFPRIRGKNYSRIQVFSLNATGISLSSLTLPQLPIHAVLPQLKAALKKGSAVLAAPPGSGKTTVIPLALLEEPWLTG